VTTINNSPLVSIGVPVYNGERFVRQALDSLLGQTYQHLEVVICDNASTDKTETICREYALKDPRIRYHRNATNIGVTPNFRRVLELSTGEYFMWASVDDRKPPTAVNNCLEALQRDPQAVMAYGPVLLRVQEQEELLEIPNEIHMSGLDVRERVRAFTLGLTSQGIVYGLYRREAIIKAVFPTCYGQEYLLCLQLCLLGALAYVRSPMVIYRLRRPTSPPYNPMYTEVPITAMNLFRLGGFRRRKCWTVLSMGCYYLLRMPGVGITQRVQAVMSHLASFNQRYHRRLAKEVVFLLFLPVSYLAAITWSMARRWSVAGRVARKVQTLLLRA
jgi:glycosyltransferase involved in cell wall biosynthesis